jgi:DNA mismatch repair protein MutS2
MTIFVFMVFPENYEEKIGFVRIREAVESYCHTDAAKTILNGEVFLSDHVEISEKLSKVWECMQMISVEGFAMEPYADMGESLGKLTMTGGYLEIEEVAGLRKNIAAVRSVLGFYGKGGHKDKYPALSGLAAEVKVYPFVQDRIDKVLSRNDTIRDQASRELARIRVAMADKEKQVARMLQSILKTVQADGISDAGTELSIRNGRPVIPVSASNKRQVSGIVHDESASGKTVFIEPGEVVSLNNEIRELGYAEQREIIRILAELSSDLEPYAEEMLAMTRFLSTMDMIQAKARYAADIRGVMPEVVPAPLIEWKKAVHPILYKTLKKEKRKVVPLDIKLNSEKRLLIISGPNAGGKSVCLQTVGLLQYMVQCGFPVPMNEDSKVGVFERIFIDIGDEQSIDNDLSTYSSHLLNMKHFIRNANGSSLLLIDEFGTGTEPVLGGAIAEAILDRLNSLFAWGVMTTHYSNLKHFAAEAEGIENGAMLFDTGKMKPLYRLEIGQPGSSFAFEIARTIGLPEDVIEDASKRVGEDHVEFDKHLRQIIRDKKYWEGKRDRIRMAEKQLQKTLGQYASELEDAENTRREILKQARQEAGELLHQANRKIENTIREIRENQAEKEKTRLAREKLRKFREEEAEKPDRTEQSGEKKAGPKQAMPDSSAWDTLGEKIAELRDKEKAVKHKRQRYGQLEPARKTDEKPLDTSIHKGDHVIMKGQEVIGEVLEKKGNKASVRFGHLSTRVTVDRLEKVPEEVYLSTVADDFSPGDYAEWDIARRRIHFRPEIDIRGQRAEEALRNVTLMIDEAIMVRHRDLRILHGKGDGILRSLIRQYLDSIDLVESYGDEHVDLGGAGVTVVLLDV